MSDEISQENVHEYLFSMYDEENESEPDDDWLEPYYPSDIPEDIRLDIKVALEDCPHDVSLERTVGKLTGKLNQNGYQEKLAAAIMIYILECPKDEREKRISNVKAVMVAWSECRAPLLSEINKVLKIEKLLPSIPSRNLVIFIVLCLNRNVFDGKDLLIHKYKSTNRRGDETTTSLRLKHADELRIRIYGKRNQSHVSENSELSDDVFDDGGYNPGVNNSANNVVREDNTSSNIMRLLMRGMERDNLPETVAMLTGNLNPHGYQERLANTIISYILECPNSELELKQRTECVEAVMKAWSDSGPLVLNAINTALTAAEPLKSLQSRNLFDFINCCLDRKAFDGEDLRINENESTSLQAEHAKQLRSRIYPNSMKALAKKFLNQCRRILSALFCCNFHYI